MKFKSHLDALVNGSDLRNHIFGNWGVTGHKEFKVLLCV